MTVIAEVVLRGLSREQYDAVRERTGWLERTPVGGLAHLTWWEGDDCHNLDAWESEAAFGAFGDQRLAPAMAGLGLDVQPAELSVTPESFIDGGDTVAVLGTHHGRTVAGTCFEIPFVHIWTWRAGKTTSFTEYFDTAPLIPDLGRTTTGAAPQA